MGYRRVKDYLNDNELALQIISDKKLNKYLISIKGKPDFKCFREITIKELSCENWYEISEIILDYANNTLQDVK